MKEWHVPLCFLLYLPWITFTVGLECPACIHVSANNANHRILQVLLNNPELKAFRDVECEKDVENRKTQIQIEKCGDLPGKVSRCGNFSGLVDMNIKGFGLTVSVKLYQRGCYFFEQSNVPTYGCRYRKNKDEDAKLVNQTLSNLAAQIPLLRGATVNKGGGELCLFEETNTVTTTVATPTTVNVISGGGKSALFKGVFFFAYSYNLLFLYVV